MDDIEGELIIGTYEDFVLGYNLMKNGKSYLLEQSFAVRSHSGSVRCLATNQSGTIAISCGIDEMVNIFDLKRRKLLQTVEVAATCATFVQDSHFILGSSTGHIYIYEFNKASISLVKTLVGHKENVFSLSVHPSNKVLLSLSKDNTMRTWNLIKGRIAYVTNIKTTAHTINWSPNGDQFIISTNNELYLYDITGVLKNTITLDKRMNCLDFRDENNVIVALESGHVQVIDLNNSDVLLNHKVHENRVKSVRLMKQKMTDGLERAVTVSSDGQIKIWSLNKAGKLEKLAEISTGARLTCLALRANKDAT